MATEADNVQFHVELCENEDWGVKLANNLQVLAIRSGGPFDRKALVGDQIVKVNKTPVKTIQEFGDVINQSAFVLQITVLRGTKPAEKEAVAKSTLPPEREKNVQRHDGYSYHLSKVDYEPGRKFGLGIKHFQNKVLVSRVDDGSLSAKALLLGDRIVDIDGIPVTDKNVARDLLLRGLQKNQTVSFVIERAETNEAKEVVKKALTASELEPPSVVLNSDVQDIIRRQKEKMKAQNEKPKGGIIRRSESKGAGRRVSITDNRKDVVIASDHEGKALKRVAK